MKILIMVNMNNIFFFDGFDVILINNKLSKINRNNKYYIKFFKKSYSKKIKKYKDIKRDNLF